MSFPWFRAKLSVENGLSSEEETLPRVSRSLHDPDALIQRGVRLVFEPGRLIADVARDIGLPVETLRTPCVRSRPIRACGPIYRPARSPRRSSVRSART